jgi:hypothetical protein
LFANHAARTAHSQCGRFERPVSGHMQACLLRTCMQTTPRPTHVPGTLDTTGKHPPCVPFTAKLHRRAAFLIWETLVTGLSVSGHKPAYCRHASMQTTPRPTHVPGTLDTTGKHPPCVPFTAKLHRLPNLGDPIGRAPVRSIFDQPWQNKVSRGGKRRVPIGSLECVNASVSLRCLRIGPQRPLKQQRLIAFHCGQPHTPRWLSPASRGGCAKQTAVPILGTKTNSP